MPFFPGSDYETPQKLCNLDSEFVLDTPNRRGQAEIPGVMVFLWAKLLTLKPLLTRSTKA